METAAIIAEYNPFHMGHRYHIEKTRELTGADYLIAVMSGDFVQRGEPACTDKYFRTRMAMEQGADLVIELPVFFSVSSAEFFASGGVSLLEQLGCVDYLSFGSEWASLADYQPYVRLFSNEGEAYKELLRSYLKEGISYPAARNKAASVLLPDMYPDSFLKEPNHILGLEYLKALSRSGSGIKPLVVIRKGAAYHDGRLNEGDFSSASAIRRACAGLLSSGTHLQTHDLRRALGETADPFIEHIFAGETVCWDDLMPLLDYVMLMEEGCKASTMNKDPGSSGRTVSGFDYDSELIRHIVKHYVKGCSFERLVSTLHSKNRTDTAIKRALLHILLKGGPANGRGMPAPYARILGFRKRAVPLLREMQKKSEIPLIQRPARGLTLFPDGQTAGYLYRLDVRAANLYEQVTARKSSRPVISELSRQQIIME